MLKARDIMTKVVVTVKVDSPLSTVIDLLLENDISGIPVVTDDMTLVAIISEKDILKLFASLDGSLDKTVYDFMTQPAIFFEEHECLAEVRECLANHEFRRVPVTSHGKLVGIISRRDIIRSMLPAAYADAKTPED
jgi:CBS domain-containing protein